MRVATDPRGTVFVVWLASQAFSFSPTEVWAAIQRLDGSSLSPVRIDLDDTGLARHFSTELQIVVDRDGGASVAWGNDERARSAIRLARYEGGGWTSPLSVPGSEGSTSFVMVKGPRERVTLAWATASDVHSATYSPTTGWSTPERIGGSDLPPAIVSAVASDRTTAVGWLTVSVNYGRTPIYQAAAYTALRRDRGWEDATRLPAGDTILGLSLGIDRSDVVVAAWSDCAATFGCRPPNGIRSSSARPGEGWSPPETFGGQAFGLTVGPGGDVVMAVQARNGIFLRRFHGQWSAPVRDPTADPRAWSFDMSVDEWGGLLLAWARRDPDADTDEVWSLSPASEPRGLPFRIDPRDPATRPRRLASNIAVTSGPYGGTVAWSERAEWPESTTTLWVRSYRR